MKPHGRLVGREIDGRFRLLSLLGYGGLGEVYEAEDLHSGRRVAVKTLLPAFQRVRGGVLRLERGAPAGGLIDHPNIVDVMAMGALDNNALYLIMELVRGVDVAALLDQGSIHPRRALVIARQTLTGLGHVHDRGLVHRDLKPENLMVTRAGQPGA